MRTVALRTALIWHDELMDDVVVKQPTKITLGPTKRATFVVPDLGLPTPFAIVRPGRRGYLLTLGEHMRGTVCIEGVQKDVAELVRTGSEGGFHATPISGRDWGVIDLDPSGVYKLFFQFVPVDDEPQFASGKVVVGGLLGYLLSAALVAGFFTWQGEAIEEAAARGAALNAAALIAGFFIWRLVKQDADTQASTAFSVVLHAALLVATYELADLTNNWAWPGRKDLIGDYLLTRIPDSTTETIPVSEATVGAVAKAASEAAPKSPTKKAARSATVGAEGAAGGKGDTERARDPDATDKPPPPREALLTAANTREIENVVQRSTEAALKNFASITGDKRPGSAGFGPGEGTGVGSGVGTGTTRGSKDKGTGASGKTEGDHVTKKGQLDTGKERPGGDGGTGAKPKEVKLTLAGAGGDLNGYTEEEIKRAIKTREPIFRKCYQKQLDRTPGLSGKLVVRFKIGPDGTVKSTSKAPGSTLSNDGVEECVMNNVGKLTFAKKGVVANVTFPFVYSQGS